MRACGSRRKSTSNPRLLKLFRHLLSDFIISSSLSHLYADFTQEFIGG